MAAGGGRGTGSTFGREGEPLLLDDGHDPAIAPPVGLTATRRRAPPLHQTKPRAADPHPPSPSTSDDDAGSEVSGSTVESSVASSSGGYSMSASGASGEGAEEEEVWLGGVSCVVGLQKRGLRGLMEGRRMRERGKGGGGGGGVNGVGAVGLGIV